MTKEQILELIEGDIARIARDEIKLADDRARGTFVQIENENKKIEVGILAYHAEVNGITIEEAKELIGKGLINIEEK